MFHVGQKVVCVLPPENQSGYGWEKKPVIGQTYTVRLAYVSPNSGLECIYLEEIVNPHANYGLWFMEFGFRARRFRPLDPLEQQLEEIEKEAILELV